MFETFYSFRSEIRRVRRISILGVYQVWDEEGRVSVVSTLALLAMRDRPVLRVRERDGRYAVEALIDQCSEGMAVSRSGAAMVLDLVALDGQSVRA